MEDTLKLILSKLNGLEEGQKTMQNDISQLKNGQARLEGKVSSIEGKIDKLTEKETDHFKQVLDEIQYTYEGLDKRITPLEAKV
jgi:peptidoglycan hydrolase CwlO-like protein